MVKIRNTRPDVKTTRCLFDSETMGDHYDPPGIRFDQDDGEVARIKAECADAVVEKFDHLELVTDDEDDGMNGPVDSSDGEPDDDDGPPDHARDGDSPIDGGPPDHAEGDGPDDDAGNDPADDGDDPGKSGSNGRNDNNGERGNN